MANIGKELMCWCLRAMYGGSISLQSTQREYVPQFIKGQFSSVCSFVPQLLISLTNSVAARNWNPIWTHFPFSFNLDD